MTQPSTRTMPARSGDIGTPGERPASRFARQRSSQTARRRWLVLFAVVVLVVVAFLANLGPLTHYQDARARLQKVTGKVDTLQTQKADLQGRLAKLNETGYLETLAREQLTYVRPGEELYIVTKPAGDAGAAAAVGGAEPVFAGPGATSGGAETSPAGTGAAQSPGLIERVISAIRGLF